MYDLRQVCIDADVNECATNNGGCHPTATCTNNYGSFICACQPGYVGDGIDCTGNYKRFVALLLAIMKCCFSAPLRSLCNAVLCVLTATTSAAVN